MRKQRFTLIELMFCVGILIILIGIAGVAGAKVLRKSADTQIKGEIKQIDALLSLYYEDHGFIPLKDDKIISEGIDYKYLKVSDGYFVDPYDRPYKVRINGNIFTIETTE